jgi:transposase InsO family protein
MRHRLKIVKDYRARRHAGSTEREAAEHTAERFATSTRSVRRYDHRRRTGGKWALMPRYTLLSPRAPSRSWPSHSWPSHSWPSHSWPSHSWAVIGTVLALRAHLGWCGQRIAAELAQRGIAEISHMAVYRLFRRYHVPVRTYHPVGKRDGIRYRRQQVRAPNWTWHVDFAGPLVDSDGVKRSMLVVVDSYSRMLLALDVVEDQTAATAERVLAGLFERYGTPRVLITDNGAAFAPPQQGYDHRFARFLCAHGVESAHGVEHRRTKPYYPQTNGKAEASADGTSAVKTVKRELLRVLARFSPDARWRWSEVAAQTAAFAGWYNFYRAHGALGYAVPASRYAGVRLPKAGLRSVFGLGVAGAAVDVASLPQLTAANRVDRLALTVVS